MNNDYQMEDASNFNKREATHNKNRYQDDSKLRLKKIITTKLKTSFIGSISSFEQAFGEIWGRGLVDADLTEKERYWRNLWNSCRNEILNNGNNQIRSCENEISQYIISWNRHQNILKKKED